MGSTCARLPARLGAALVALVTLSGSAAAQTPVIEITYVPPYLTIADLSGHASNVVPSEYHVAAYLFMEGLGWYVKPTLLAPCTPLSSTGDFVVDVTTGGFDERATRYAVFLLPIQEPCPPPPTPEFLSSTLAGRPMDLVERTGWQWHPSLRFAGLTWLTRGSPYFGGPSAPGDSTSNCFAEDHAFTDASGQLHLALQAVTSVGQCGAEVWLPRSLGYGEYRVHTTGRLDTLDPRAVFGLFLWDPDAQPAHREMDFEFSRWGVPGDPLNAQFVVQPFATAGNRERFTVGASEADVTLLLDWRPGTATFAAFRGHHLGVPPELDLVHRRTFTSGVPEPGRERVRLNLWRYCASTGACDAMPDQEVVLTHFSHVPSPRSFHTLTPCRLVDTRNPDGPRGGPALVPVLHRSFRMARFCGVPDTARALSLNVTVTRPGVDGHLLLYPEGDNNVLSSSTINFAAGQTRANNAVVAVGDGGYVAATFGTGPEAGFVHLIVDVNGYFE